MDHPHAYGDKIVSSATDPYFLGSSPRVWGQEADFFIISDLARIIPTRMGTSAKNILFAKINRDHPHAYGDKKITL